MVLSLVRVTVLNFLPGAVWILKTCSVSSGIARVGVSSHCVNSSTWFLTWFVPHVIRSDDELCSTVEEVSVSGD